MSMPPSSGAGAYSATTLPTYQRPAYQAPSNASSAGINSSQRVAGGLNLIVITDFDLGTAWKDEGHKSPFADICPTDFRGLSEMASILIDSRIISILRSSHKLRSSAMRSSEM